MLAPDGMDYGALAANLRKTCLETASNLDVLGPDAEFAAGLNRLAAQALCDGWSEEARDAVHTANQATSDFFNQWKRSKAVSGNASG